MRLNLGGAPSSSGRVVGSRACQPPGQGRGMGGERHGHTRVLPYRNHLGRIACAFFREGPRVGVQLMSDLCCILGGREGPRGAVAPVASQITQTDPALAAKSS